MTETANAGGCRELRRGSTLRLEPAMQSRRGARVRWSERVRVRLISECGSGPAGEYEVSLARPPGEPTSRLSLRSARESRLAVWNVRTLNGEGKLELLARALSAECVDVCCICETRAREAGEVLAEDPEGGERFRAWVGAARGGVGGVGVAVRSGLGEAVESWKAVSERVKAADPAGRPEMGCRESP